MEHFLENLMGIKKGQMGFKREQGEQGEQTTMKQQIGQIKNDSTPELKPGMTFITRHEREFLVTEIDEENIHVKLLGGSEEILKNFYFKRASYDERYRHTKSEFDIMVIFQQKPLKGIVEDVLTIAYGYPRSVRGEVLWERTAESPQTNPEQHKLLDELEKIQQMIDSLRGQLS